MFPVHFDPAAPTFAARWVLEYPFLAWDPATNEHPKLPCRLAGSGAVEMLDVLGVLGRGGFGVVFEVVHRGERLAIKVPSRPAGGSSGLTLLATNIADLMTAADIAKATTDLRAEVEKGIKRLHTELQTSSAGKRLRKFRRESIILHRLRHPNVVTLKFVADIPLPPDPVTGNDVSLPCLAMEMVEGTKLRDVILNSSRDLRAELPTIARICRDVALAVAAMHDQNVYHRDLTWNNIMIGPDDHVTVIDLGNVNDPDGRKETMELLLDSSPEFPIPLTIGFVAPEHVNFWRAEGPADQFSLGVIIYLWCCKGVNWPYLPDSLTGFVTANPDDPEQPISLEKRKVTEVATPAWTKDEQKSFHHLSMTVQRMLQKLEGQRFPRMRDVAAELQCLLIDLNEEIYDDFDVVELSPVGEFIELCRQVKFKKPAPTHGSLFLQLMVSQARTQLSRTIAHVWQSLFDTFHGSADLGRIDGVATAVDQIDKMVNELITATQVVLGSFSRSSMAASRTPRFGGQLQNLMVKVKEELQILIQQSRDCERVVRKYRGLGDEDQDRRDALVKEAAQKVSSLWDVVSDTQGRLADCDFALAVYTTRVRRTLKKSQGKT